MANEERIGVGGGSRRRDKKKGGILRITALYLAIAITLVSVFNIIYFHHVHLVHENEENNRLSIESMSNKAVVEKKGMKKGGKNNENIKEKKEYENKEEEHSVAGLSCSKYGGPLDDAAVTSEMVYWSDIPSDSKYHSPFYSHNKSNTKYLLFEPDHGGWNNIRMAMETALVMAHAMGRTLVIPPEKDMYLLHKKRLTFNDFFHLESIDREHEKFDIITMEEFLNREAMTGNLYDTATQASLKPPDNRSAWDGHHLDPLWKYIRKVSYNLGGCETMQCFIAMPATTKPENVHSLRLVYEHIVNETDGRKKPVWEDFIGKPTPVDAPVKERMREMLAERHPLIYDVEMQKAKVLFPTDRLLSSFYTHIFFEDWRQDLWSKRFIRDHMRYVDEIMCAAARIVVAVREKARKYDATNANGTYDSMHVRRGDFQFTPTRLPAEELYQKSEKELTQGATLYIATDEKNKTFFEPLAKKYNILFLDDFADQIAGVDKTYYGMLDQVVASKGRVFFGTWWSTLSGYVNRMRGYYITKHKLEGYENGTMESYYFTPEERRMVMVDYHPVKNPFYMREFPTAWRDIDKGIEDIQQLVNSADIKEAKDQQ